MELLKEMAKNNVLGNPVRLGIMLYLLPRGKALFINIQRVLNVTPGNLDSHLKSLQREGFVRIKKILADRPRTAVWITDLGAEKTRNYINLLRKVIDTENH